MKKALSLILVSIMLLAFAACGAPAEKVEDPTAGPASATEATTAAGAPGETVTLKLWGGVQPEYGYDELCENFNQEFKDKGIQVEYTRYVNNDDGNLQLDTYLMGSNEIDVFMGYGGRTRLSNRVDAGLVLDMTPYLEARGFDPITELGANNVSNCMINGSFYGVPTKYENANWMFVNVDAFKEAGLEIPYNGWTYAEFMEACEKLTHGEGPDKVYAINWSFNDTAIPVFLGSCLNEAKTYANEDCTETSYASEAWIDGVQLLIDTMKNGWCPTYEEYKADNLTFQSLYLTGKCAMSTNIAFMRYIADLEGYPHDFETAFVPCPVPDESYMDNYDYRTIPGAGDLICVNPKSEHIEEAMDFVCWYIQGGMAPLAKGGRIPLWNGFSADKIVDYLASNDGVFDVQSLKNYLAVDTSQVFVKRTTANDSKVNAILTESLESAFYGQMTAEQACQDACSRANELLKNS